MAGLLQPTTYVASALVEIVAADDLIAPSVTSGELDDQELATQVQVLRSEPVAAVVVDRLGLDRTPLELLDGVAAQRIGDARVLQVTAQGDDPEQARSISVTFAEAYLERRAAAVATRVEILRDQLERQRSALEARLQELGTAEASDAEARAVGERLAEVVADLGELPAGIETEMAGHVVRGPQGPTEGRLGRALPQAALGTVLGLLLGLGIALVRDRVDARVRDDDDLLDVLAVEVLEHVHGLDADVLDAPGPGSHEDLRRLHAVLSARAGTTRRLLVVAPGRDGDAATVAVALGGTAWRSGRSVVLVDGDLRRAELSTRAGLAETPGLAELLLGAVDDVTEVVVEDVAGPALLPAGIDRPAGLDRLGDPALADILDGSGEGRQVVIAGPAAPASADLLWLASHVDAVLLVVTLQHTRSVDLRQTAGVLAHAGRPVYGLVVRTG